MDNNNRAPIRPSVKYSIIEKSALTSIHFHDRTQQFIYSAVSECRFSSLLERLINDQQFKPISTHSCYYFFDELGRFINNETIGELYRNNGTGQVIIQIQEQNDDFNLFEITLNEQKISVFHPVTKWQQIEIWRKLVLPEIDFLCVFLNRENETLLDENQSIASIDMLPTTLHGIAQTQAIPILISFGTAYPTSVCLEIYQNRTFIS